MKNKELFKDCLGYLYELLGEQEWKRDTTPRDTTPRNNRDIKDLEETIALVKAKVMPPVPKNQTNKGRCKLGVMLEDYRIFHNLGVWSMSMELRCSDTSYRQWIRGSHQPKYKATIRKIERLIGDDWKLN